MHKLVIDEKNHLDLFNKLFDIKYIRPLDKQHNSLKKWLSRRTVTDEYITTAMEIDKWIKDHYVDVGNMNVGKCSPTITLSFVSENDKIEFKLLFI